MINKAKLVLYLLMGCVLLNGTPVLADINPAYEANDILFYKEGEGDTESCSNIAANNSPLVGDDNLKKIYNYFLGQGMSIKASAAMVGNIYQESKGDPLLRQGGRRTDKPETVGVYKDGRLFENKPGDSSVGDAWGLPQWDPGNAVLYWQKQAGVQGNPATMEVQLEIIMWQLKNLAPTSQKNVLARVEAAGSLGEAVQIVSEKFHGAGTPNMAERNKAAARAMSYPVDPSIVVSDGVVGVGTCAPGVGAAGGFNVDGMTVYHQDQEPWKNQSYGGKGTIQKCGCGPTSAAMVVATLKKDTSVTPKTMADWAAANGGQSSGGNCGSQWFWGENKFMSTFGVRSIDIGPDFSKISTAISRGSLVIISTGNGSSNSTPFAGGGHILVIRGVTDKGKFLVANPLGEGKYSGQTTSTEGFAPSEIPVGSSGLKGAWEISLEK